MDARMHFVMSIASRGESEPHQGLHPLANRAEASESTLAPKRAEALDVRPLATLLERIKAAYHPLQVWLFGSRARGDARESSDWDLLVAVSDETDELELSPVKAWRLQRGSGVYADVIPCRASELRSDRDTVNTLAYVVAREGVLLYELGRRVRDPRGADLC